MPKEISEAFDVTKHFDENRAEIYDRLIRQAIPGYEALHHMARLFLAHDLPDEADILVAGAGTGMDVLTLGREFPKATFTAVDPSPDMLDVAQARVGRSGMGDRVDFHHGYVSDLAESPRFDAATLLLVIHFVADDPHAPGGGMLGLLKSIAARLKPGAPLVLAHVHGDRGSEKYRLFMEVWRKWQLDAGISEEEVDKGFKHVEENCHFTTEERLLELLAVAAFTGPQSFYEALLFGGWIAWKAPPPGSDAEG